jgi:hypothetical protein
MGNSVWNPGTVNPTGNVVGIPSNAPFNTVAVPAYTDPVLYTLGSSTVNVAAGAATPAYAFHLFSGQQTPQLPHVILMVAGEYATGYYTGDEKYFCGYVTFTKYNSAAGYVQSIENNKIYKMGLQSPFGIPINAEDVTDRPELEDFDLGINVTVTAWSILHVTPEP